MRRVLRHWRRLLLGVFLLGLGYVLHQRLPPVERWSVCLNKDSATSIFISFSPDGRFMFSHLFPKMGNPPTGPFQKRDVTTGLLLVETSARERVYLSHSVEDFVFRNPPARKRFWAGLPKKKNSVLDLLDLESGEENRVSIKPYPGSREIVTARPQD